jgi:ABC-2 type transport system permease protein
MTTAFLALIRKDLLLYFRDRRSVVMSFIAPIAIASFLAVALGGIGRPARPSRVTIALVDEDDSRVSQLVYSKLSSSELLDLRRLDRASAQDQVRNGKLSIAAILPKNFGSAAARAFSQGGEGKPDLEILYDPSRLAERQLVEGILTGKVVEAVSAEVFSPPKGSGFFDEALAQFDQNPAIPVKRKEDLKTLVDDLGWLQRRQAAGGPTGFSGLSIPFTTTSEAITARKGQIYDGVAHSFSGMGVQFILFMGIEAGVALLLQRQRGLWSRLRSAPVSKTVLLGSRALSSAICAFLILVVMFLFARVVFGVRIEGSYAGFALVGVAFAIMTAAFGLLIAALGGTPEGTRPIAVLATLLMVMLGGAWVPLFIFPAWLQRIALVMPTRWAVEGLDSMTWRGLGFEATLFPCAIILLYAVIFGAIALNRFKWEAD